ncbi:arginyl-tRNA---protein transferase [Marchantia polymorpha subsp. ruderalis]|uniref:arginyltransferase n=2 Tax=Marchantia polymorpha TaxID=3197 RepID=A0AAF6C1C8_MARPO|nr:hypothetical protein MARPO_0067s0057 [Marchantia polymorpha]BBN18062.1 hypothetical protein Mp_7g19210 [Marchantia polymorpha subsp. ruderalis]|eukprot:PTQ35972.1 hypothetical protein MARPO_0067s0057 [Marchantia polymorpha]
MTSVTDPKQGQGELSSTSTTTTASSSSGGGGNSRRRARDRRMMSLVEDLGVYDSSCGYCKATNRSSRSQGLWAHELAVQDYQDLLDRGWRRSGMFLYKPCMKETCCPPYTIRLKVDAFVATKDQIRVRRRLQRYLDGTYSGPQTVGELHEEKNDVVERETGVPSDSIMASSSDRKTSNVEQGAAGGHGLSRSDVVEADLSDEEKLIESVKFAIKTSITKCVEKGVLPQSLEVPEVVVKPISQKVKDKLKVESRADFTSNVAFPLAATVKRLKKIEIQDAGKSNLQQGSILVLTPQEIAENLVIVLSELFLPGVAIVTASNGYLNFLLSDVKMSSPKYLVGEKQVNQSVHVTTSEQLLELMKPAAPGFTRKLEIRMARSSFDAEEFALYKKYQIAVHNDRPEGVRESHYKQFLVDTPLVFIPPANNGTTPSCGYGSFHQQYRVDGKLVAVGVIDILPHCLSSKYLFWDPDFAFLSLGKYSALQEIEWVQKEQRLCPTFQYYYLGFYIHSCPKMRYKAAYYPSELLCPERYRWVSYEVARPLLDKQSYVCLSDFGTSTSASEGSSIPGKTRGDAEAAARDDITGRQGNSGEVYEASDEPVNWEERRHVAADDGAQSALDRLGLVGDISVFLAGSVIPFKQLRASTTMPRQHLDKIATSLRIYLHNVGPRVATRMAYAVYEGQD